MNTAKQLFDELIYRMKTTDLNKFEIKREVETGWLPNGVVPFNINVKNSIATFVVWAESIQDAEHLVSQFLEQDEHE